MRKIGNNTYIKIVFDGVRLIITPMVDKGKYLQEFDVGVNLTENEADELLVGYSKESLMNMQAAVQKRLQCVLKVNRLISTAESKNNES